MVFASFNVGKHFVLFFSSSLGIFKRLVNNFLYAFRNSIA